MSGGWYISGRAQLNALDLGSVYSRAEIHAVGGLVPLLVQPEMYGKGYRAACLNEQDRHLASLLIAAIRSFHWMKKDA